MDETDYRNMVEELCDCESGLSNWECDFVSSMLEWTGRYTPAQKQVIEKIYDSIFK